MSVSDHNPALDLDSVRRQLTRVSAPSPGAETPRAAVATILRPCPQEGVEVLFIRRAEHPLDPWSGHMAFPGGRYEPSDTDLRETAIRETREEVGLDLETEGELLSPLADVPTHKTGLIVRPFVWQVTGRVALRPNYEVDEVHWTPIGPLLRGAHDTTYRFEYRGQPVEMPAYRVGDRVVWGLTYRMLQIFFSHLRGALALG